MMAAKIYNVFLLLPFLFAFGIQAAIHP